jgi:hypothetical protein
VLRSYDSRCRPTERSPVVYQECKEVFDKGVNEVVNLPKEDSVQDTIDAVEPSRIDSFWIDSKERGLLIIAIPFRPGCHYAKRPSEFVPIINELQKLHKSGFVHGDIRAFNIVFGTDTGHLIDFDFGGKVDKVHYPTGYRQMLKDGIRPGTERDLITKSDDWHALGQLIFYIHGVNLTPDLPKGEEDVLRNFLEIQHFWMDIEIEPTCAQVHKLKTFLESEYLRVVWAQNFRKLIHNNGATTDTNEGATGSPLKATG